MMVRVGARIERSSINEQVLGQSEAIRAVAKKISAEHAFSLVGGIYPVALEGALS